MTGERNVLWAPWRGAYVGGKRKPGCPFCLALAEEGAAQVVASNESAFAMMNLYPYAPGHLMVLPRRHTGSLEDLTTEEVSQMWALVVKAKLTMEKLYRAEGFNIGMNLGKPAGAGIVDHLHIHVVPRWSGDNNFMPVLADVRVIPKHLDEVRLELKKVFADG